MTTVTSTLARTGRGVAQAIYLGTVQKKAYTGTAAAIDNAVGAGTSVIRVYCTSDAHIAIGAAPVATTADTPISAGHAEYFGIGSGEKVSAIQQNVGGDLYVTECAAG